jgi:hypothetical protein
MEQLKDEFSKMLFDQQKQMMAQFEVPYLHLGIIPYLQVSGKNIEN